MRVLVADDDRVFSQLICAMLRAAGHQAFPAFDGATTMMAAIRQPGPDLIVLDLQMPAGDGATTLAKLKQSARTTLIPVLIVSGSTDPLAPEHLAALGAAGYLQKPVTKEDFIGAVERLGTRPKT